MRHAVLRCLAVLIVAATLWPVHARNVGTGNTAASQTRAFYAWFIAHDTDAGYPLADPAIEQFVAKETVTRLREDYRRAGPPEGVDYFLKVQDYDTRDWQAHTAIHPAVVLGQVTVVPVTFGATHPVSVLVFLTPRDGAWKIIKVDDTRGYR